jgi:hypothetical protein
VCRLLFLFCDFFLQSMQLASGERVNDARGSGVPLNERLLTMMLGNQDIIYAIIVV